MAQIRVPRITAPKSSFRIPRTSIRASRIPGIKIHTNIVGIKAGRSKI